MTTYFQLLVISCAPALTGILLTLPFWRIRKFTNQEIFVSGLVVLFAALAGCLIPAFQSDEPGFGLSAILVCSINFSLFRHYMRILYTTRCPNCRHGSLRIHTYQGRYYRLHCRHCGLCTEWRE